jgi:hypothetical protein
MSILINKTTMKAKEKHKINVAIHKALKPTYFDTIQLGTCINILEQHGYTIIQEDYTPWDGIICGPEGHEYFTIAVDNFPHPSNEDEMPNTVHVVNNAMLSLSWHKMSSGRYEVIAYVC